MKIEQIRTYVLRGVTDEEMDAILAGMRVGLSTYQSRYKEGMVTDAEHARMILLTTLVDEMYDAWQDAKAEF